MSSLLLRRCSGSRRIVTRSGNLLEFYRPGGCAFQAGMLVDNLRRTLGRNREERAVSGFLGRTQALKESRRDSVMQQLARKRATAKTAMAQRPAGCGR